MTLFRPFRHPAATTGRRPIPAGSTPGWRIGNLRRSPSAGSGARHDQHGPDGHPAARGGSDYSIAATYAMLAAESLGLGTCLIGAAVALERDKHLKQKYGIPLGNKLGLLMVLGYPAVKSRHGVRRRLASVRCA